MNVAPVIAMALSMQNPRITFRDLHRMGLEDLHDLIEIGLVNLHNARLAAKRLEQQQRGH